MRALLKALIKAMVITRCAEYRDRTAALADLDRLRPDFILTDLSMVPMDGVAFSRALRNGPEGTRLTPIIMVTGHTERHRVERARDAGVNEILAKPITIAGLYHRIEEIIMRPRQFVRADTYFGPDRRRRANPEYMGPFRRASDGDMHDLEMPAKGGFSTSGKDMRVQI